MQKSNKNTSYKASMARLNDILDEINSDDLDIDQLSNLIDESVKLVKSCKSTLRNTEKKVEKSLLDLEEHLKE